MNMQPRRARVLPLVVPVAALTVAGSLCLGQAASTVTDSPSRRALVALAPAPTDVSRSAVAEEILAGERPDGGSRPAIGALLTATTSPPSMPHSPDRTERPHAEDEASAGIRDMGRTGRPAAGEPAPESVVRPVEVAAELAPLLHTRRGRPGTPAVIASPVLSALVAEAVRPALPPPPSPAPDRSVPASLAGPVPELAPEPVVGTAPTADVVVDPPLEIPSEEASEPPAEEPEDVDASGSSPDAVAGCETDDGAAQATPPSAVDEAADTSTDSSGNASSEA